MVTVHRFIAMGLAALVLATGLGAPSQGAPAPTAEPAAEGYLLGPGDKVKVVVYGEDELSGEYVVSASGAISLPLAGDIPASGSNTDALQSKIKAALQPKYLKDANVSVAILNMRPFYILGEVDKPGQYPYAAGMTILGAVATAGGFTYRANTHNVYIKHASEKEEHRYQLSASIAVSAGDTIRIEERHF